MTTTPGPYPLNVEAIFSFHPADTVEKAMGHEAVRDACKFAATELLNVVPVSPEQTLMIRALQQAMMWGNSAIAQYGVKVNG